MRLERVTEQIEIDLDSLAYLSAHGFVPGTEATVASKDKALKDLKAALPKLNVVVAKKAD